jgi:hypothetical protein
MLVRFTHPTVYGIGELSGITGLDLSGIDFVNITDLSPLHAMDDLTDLWLIEAENLGASDLDVLLDNLATMEGTDTEGVLYLTQADFDVYNTAGGGLLAAWDAEPGHHVYIATAGDANFDGIVDDADASILAAHWQQTGKGWRDGDFNNDGVVNDQDASILAAHWQQTAEGTAEVPEPAAVMMLLCGTLTGLLVYPRRGRRLAHHRGAVT